MSIRFTKPVIGLSKYVIRAAIKYTGHPGRRFLTASPLVFAASPLCVFAFKLLKNFLNRQATKASMSKDERRCCLLHVTLKASVNNSYQSYDVRRNLSKDHPPSLVLNRTKQSHG